MLELVTVAGLLLVGWLLYRAGFQAGRTRQARLDNLYACAQAEPDPERRGALLAAWTKLAGPAR